MNIQSVTVEIHEKRNHPHEYGHYDALVAYTAQVEEGESAEDVINRLRVLARQQVEAECDRWIKEIELEVKRAEAKQRLYWIVSRAKSGNPDGDDDKDFEEYTNLLSEDEQKEYRDKLAAAKQEYVSCIKDRLDGYIEDIANRRGSLVARRKFDAFLEYLSEAEREEYRARMEAATAQRVEAAPQDDPRF
jgi:uncharacterized protein with PIN domain